MAHRVPSGEDASSTNVMFCPLSNPNELPRSLIILQRSNDNAACGHDSKFKPLVLGEIQAADDTWAGG
jgi:hypothetical protein